MIYTTTSSEEVIGRVFRNTRVPDASYANSMNEWIPEAMGYMRTRVQLQTVYKDVTVRYHKGRMPCGLVNLKAIQYGGCRLRHYRPSYPAQALGQTSSSSPSVYPGIPVRGTTPFGTHLVARETTDEDVPVIIYETDLKSLELLGYGDDWYYTELDYINTSFSDGCIRVFFDSIPVDSKGFPLIPDEENYKEALYWYCRAKMIGAGFEDKVFNYQNCMDYYEKHAERAISKITYPSVDETESRIRDITRFIMPEDIWHLPYR